MKLNNGLTVISYEEASENLKLGIHINVGCRDENEVYSGILNVIKNAFYSKVMLKGSSDCYYSMSYNEENIFFNFHSSNHDFAKMIPNFTEMVFNIKNLVSFTKNSSENQQNSQTDIKNLLLTTAYGYDTLGMPINGFNSNHSFITPFLIQNFILNHFTPAKIIVITNKSKSIEIIRQSLSYLHPVKESEFARKPSIYYGGEYRKITNEENEMKLMLAFPTNFCEDKSIFYSLLHCIYGPRGPFNPFDENLQRFKRGED